MKEQINEELITLISKLNPQGTKQLNELLKNYLELGNSNQLDILKHTQLVNAATQLMNPA